ncbi:SMC-Scp complex subunit ScpB [Roseibium sp. RKSG952]|uniref:SMC-Scp complex subunit ScpB n=1 Tax=Roseibium sp. RKSG952 TaxID=2529384 RepID=UPI0018AD25A8|nr:SMC-Scp complex subunit ScpB [Roseibium sp. RKSG952]
MTSPKNVLECALLMSETPLTKEDLEMLVPVSVNVGDIIRDLRADYEGRGITLIETAEGWAVRTRPEYSDMCRRMVGIPRRVSRAAMETLAVVALFQPVTRPEIERVRGVSLARGTLDLLIMLGWVRPGPRRSSQGNPMTFLTTNDFLTNFGMKSLHEFPGIADMRESGLLNAEVEDPTKVLEQEN